MSKLVFELGTGNRVSYPTTCFLPLRSRTVLNDMFNSLNVVPDTVYSIRFVLQPEGFSTRGKKLMISYIDKLLAEPVIKKYLKPGVTGKSVWRDGLDLPNDMSGSGIYIIFSLLRYIVEHPGMVATVMEYAECMEFDKALYLAHFTQVNHGNFSKDLPDTSATYPNRPVNHSVVDPRKPYVGGYLFLRETLPVIAMMGKYRQNYSYGNIQGLMRVSNGRELIIPNLIGSQAHAVEIATQL